MCQIRKLKKVITKNCTKFAKAWKIGRWNPVLTLSNPNYLNWWKKLNSIIKCKKLLGTKMGTKAKCVALK